MKKFNNKKHFLQLVSKACEVRVKLLDRSQSNCAWWTKVYKEDIYDLVNKKEMITTKPLDRIEYDLHTHLVPKGGILYIQQIQNK